MKKKHQKAHGNMFEKKSRTQQYMYVQNQVKCMVSQKEQTCKTLRNELQSFLKASTEVYGRPNIK